RGGRVGVRGGGGGGQGGGVDGGLEHAFKAGAVSLGRGAADRVDNGVDLVPVPQRVERGEGHADFGPESAEDELASAGGADGLEEFDVLPGVGGGPVERLVVCQQFGEFGEGGPSPAGGYIDGRVHHRDVEGLDRLDRRDGVLDQEVSVHRVDPGQL